MTGAEGKAVKGTAALLALVEQKKPKDKISISVKGTAGARTAELTLASQVTTFTASDFGRTLSCNDDGTDHGWGSHHLVVGGAVKGGGFYGDNAAGSGAAAMPSLALSDNNPNDAGYGQIIPTTSVDQYSATLASWFGLNSSDLGLLFPNLANFTAKNLGFL